MCFYFLEILDGFAGDELVPSSFLFLDEEGSDSTIVSPSSSSFGADVELEVSAGFATGCSPTITKGSSSSAKDDLSLN